MNVFESNIVDDTNVRRDTIYLANILIRTLKYRNISNYSIVDIFCFKGFTEYRNIERHVKYNLGQFVGVYFDFFILLYIVYGYDFTQRLIFLYKKNYPIIIRLSHEASELHAIEFDLKGQIYYVSDMDKKLNQLLIERIKQYDVLKTVLQ